MKEKSIFFIDIKSSYTMIFYDYLQPSLDSPHTSASRKMENNRLLG
jgi:hypothetical protein